MAFPSFGEIRVEMGKGGLFHWRVAFFLYMALARSGLVRGWGLRVIPLSPLPDVDFLALILT